MGHVNLTTPIEDIHTTNFLCFVKSSITDLERHNKFDDIMLESTWARPIEFYGNLLAMSLPNSLYYMNYCLLASELLSWNTPSTPCVAGLLRSLTQHSAHIHIVLSIYRAPMASVVLVRGK